MPLTSLDPCLTESYKANPLRPIDDPPCSRNPALYRQTRSGAAFSPWAAPYVTAANPNFDFAALLKAGVAREAGLSPTYDDDKDALDSGGSTPTAHVGADSGPADAEGADVDDSPPEGANPEPTGAEGQSIGADDADLGAVAALAAEVGPAGLVEPAAEPGSTTSQAKRKSRRQKSSHANRSKHREMARESFGHYIVREGLVQRIQNQAASIECEMKTEAAEVASTGFVGRDDGTRPRKVLRLDDVVGERSKHRFRLYQWDGSTPTSIRDHQTRLVAVLAGRPNTPNWPALQVQAAQALEERRPRCWLPPKQRKHRRGAFMALRCGLSHGSGQTRPGNLTNSDGNAAVLEELNRLEPFKRIAGFSSACMASWAPNLYKHYVDTLGSIYDKDRSLRPLFPGCVFSAASYNFGPRTVCFKHRDFANLPFGWCSITALGSFDPTKGGHLILWDCHLVIEFPPGSTILLPSAIVAHSNVVIAPHETRYSFALYSAGGLFRWVENKHQTAVDYYASLEGQPEALKEVRERDRNRWKEGLALLPVLTPPANEAASSSEE